jgi:hypothetical protein
MKDLVFAEQVEGRPKAELRALMDGTGYVSEQLGEDTGISPRSIRRFRSVREAHLAPEPVWERLDEAHEEQRRWIEDVYEECKGEDSVTFYYFATEREYRRNGDGYFDSFTQANAASLALAAILEHEGVTVHWANGGPVIKIADHG